KLLQVVEKRTTMQEAFQIADDVLRHGVEGISNIITIPGLINVDFADVKAVMNSSGSALMGIGSASGEGRAVEAAQKAISSPMLETSVHGASGVIFNVTGGSDLTLHEVNDAAAVIYEAVDSEANIIFGAVFDERLHGEVRITVIATGFDGPRQTVVPVSTVREQRPVVPPFIASHSNGHAPAPEAPSSGPAAPGPAVTGGGEPAPDIPDFLKNSLRRTSGH
ncbi:MAG: cell division protein FtsZ, partial [Candidatus Sericytochromatia bacterium]|nr:cell division protein FtsZ [Candidatus Sericytochromatia bacterium]